MKPRIRLQMPGSGLGYECFGGGVGGWAQTPAEAYRAWRANCYKRWVRMVNEWIVRGNYANEP